MAPIFVTTWYLEMRARPPVRRPDPPRGIVLTRMDAPTPAEYRAVYDVVGGPWLWVDRRRMPPEELAEIVRHPGVEIVVARAEGELVGYYELDRRVPGECSLAYFGLAPAWIGKRVGSWLLERAVQQAWDGVGGDRPARVIVHTCSLDHPRALRTYERAGFMRVDEVYADFDPEVP
jgi:GNAT superfamily N-acetyltransferase